jgi:DNA (cytosine-5)-methyltransferase 1
MTGATMFSGILAPEVALPEIRWIWCAEIDPYCRALIKHRAPGAVNLGDVTTDDFESRALALGPLDLLVAGSPCQAFSVAGDRRSLADSRGNLTLRLVEATHAIKPRYLLWENVPGVFSTDDNAFGCFVGGLIGADEALPLDGSDPGVADGPLGAAAWRVLDAQYFGLAQRRKRVFLVFRAGASGAHPADLLFEFEGLRRDFAPGREAGERSAPTISARTKGGGGLGTDFDCDGGVVAMALNGKGGMDRIDGESETFINTGQGWWGDSDIAAGLRTPKGSGSKEGTVIAHALRGDGFDASEDGTGRGIPLVAPCLTQNYGKQPDNSDTGAGPLLIPKTAHALDAASAGHATEDGTGRGVPLVVADPISTHEARTYSHEGKNNFRAHNLIPINSNAVREGKALTPSPDAEGKVRLRDPGMGVGEPGDSMFTLQSGQQHAVAFTVSENSNGYAWESEVAPAIQATSPSDGMRQQYGVAQPMGVRRLTPTECERLQGFPDDYTLIPYRGKPAGRATRRWATAWRSR